MSVKQQRNQPELDFGTTAQGRKNRSAEAFVAARLCESPTGTIRLMESICERENMQRALRQVLKNNGAPGIDKVDVRQMAKYYRRHREKITSSLLDGRYRPSPVRLKEIPKPEGGSRRLGIPITLDRLIAQAMTQRLVALWDHTFSEYSFGFRPERSQHDAIRHVQELIKQGYRFCVSIDLKKFFDRVNHDRLMSLLAKRISDNRVLKLIRAFLNAGIMENGVVTETKEGTPQGSPLSPLLSNIVLDELDKELEKRGLHFVRFADDCVIYVKSKRAGDRVMESVSRFITRKLKLKVNEEKSSVGQPGYGKYLGFGFTISKTNPRIRIHSKSLKRFRERVVEITARTRGRSVAQVIAGKRNDASASGQVSHSGLPNPFITQPSRSFKMPEKSPKQNATATG